MTFDPIGKILGKSIKKDKVGKNYTPSSGRKDLDENKERHYPKPDYDKCNAGHPLVEVWNDKRNAYIWDCPTCINKMRRAYNR